MDLFEQLKNSAIILMAASPRSGKTVLCEYIVYSCNEDKTFDYGIIFCPTSYINGSYAFFPKNRLHSKFDINMVKNVINIQVKQIQEVGHEKCKKAFILFDDCLGSMKFDSKENKETFEILFSKYRNYKISVIVASQKLTKYLTPLVRDCATYFCCFKQNNKKAIKHIYEEFMNDMTNETACQKFILDNTEDHHFIICNLENDVDDKYDVAKAPLIKYE